MMATSQAMMDVRPHVPLDAAMASRNPMRSATTGGLRAVTAAVQIAYRTRPAETGPLTLRQASNATVAMDATRPVR